VIFPGEIPYGRRRPCESSEPLIEDRLPAETFSVSWRRAIPEGKMRTRVPLPSRSRYRTASARVGFSPEWKGTALWLLWRVAGSVCCDPNHTTQPTVAYLRTVVNGQEMTSLPQRAAPDFTAYCCKFARLLQSPSIDSTRAIGMLCQSMLRVSVLPEECGLTDIGPIRPTFNCCGSAMLFLCGLNARRRNV
jgi:hypothetical protein